LVCKVFERIFRQHFSQKKVNTSQSILFICKLAPDYILTKTSDFLSICKFQ
jgi:hypothetical protein